ncbi:DNA polymerase III subunit delta' [Nocardioides hwasunensis]|uniref:DNA polymerase III subunit delta' n=1 Tax=Nocardioides hwasunensis TaxID=397258 RepID=A0ABR8MHK4_9ACTN|nr:DNA polymerase III subunit delta' [Nocardioides hwasunensis]MBD3915552.1 DNA polymerase III subunit delta' [Nocardioides hwasunensis]
MTTTSTASTVWDGLVGQRPTIELLKQAAAGHGMTHAWLVTGPPGSGRSNVARAFATALQCETQTGCGHCEACRLGTSGSHPDITWVRSETSVLYVNDMRDLVQSAAKFPAIGRWQIVVIEDADRLGTPENPRTGNALLKAIEEPTPKTVWLLCAPTVQDVLPTIRSRCRTLTLATPGTDDVARFLARHDQISETVAGFAARASQGHIGRARALALDERTRTRRREVVSIPARLTTLGTCMTAATTLAELAKEETEEITAAAEKRELDELQAIFGSERKDTTSRSYRAALAGLEKLQKQKAKRRVLDVIDRALMDLVSVYRDAIALSVGAPGQLVNEELRGDVESVARAASPEDLLRMIDAIFTAREQMLEFNVPPQLALESMAVALQLSGGHR